MLVAGRQQDILHLHGPVSMNGPVIKVPSDLCQKDRNLFLRPPKNSRQSCHGQCFKTLETIHVEIVPLTNLLIPFIQRPAVRWPLKNSLYNIHKSRIAQNILVLFVVLKRATNLGGCFVKKVDKLREVMVFSQGFVV